MGYIAQKGKKCALRIVANNPFSQTPVAVSARHKQYDRDYRRNKCFQGLSENPTLCPLFSKPTLVTSHVIRITSPATDCYASLSWYTASILCRSGPITKAA